MSTDPRALYHRWIEQMWNGDPELAHELVSDDFLGHWPGHDVEGPSGLVGAMTQMREMFDSITFEIEVGPIVEDDLVAGRWRGEGVAAAGEVMRFVGNDLLRVRDGRFVEYWVANTPV